MDKIKQNIKETLTSGIYNISAIERQTEISRHWMKKIVNDEKVPSYIFMALNDYFNRGLKND